MLPITVIVPVRNAAHMIKDCLDAVMRSRPDEVIVVDGCSTDGTLELVKDYPVKLISDHGQGVPAARMMGIREASNTFVMLVDVDIVLGEGGLETLFHEFSNEGYDALQAGLVSVSGGGYWGQALTIHHNRGRSKNWPGVMCTLFKREVLIAHPFDERFKSGEDIELRWRLMQENLKLGVSERTFVQHRFDDTYEFARDQFLADGKGLGRMVGKYGWRAVHLLAIPTAGSLRGILLSLLHLELKWIPYYLAYFFYNYLSMPGGLKENLSQSSRTV